MPSSIHHVSLDCHDPYRLALFWSDVFGRPIDPDSAPGDDEVGIAVEGVPGAMLFLQVPEDKTVKNRMHLCLRPDGDRDAEVERLLGLGATMVADLRKPDRGWAVLADPEGNEFCVLISAAQRAALIDAPA